MAITRLWQAGADPGGVAEFDALKTGSGTLAPTSVTTSPKTGPRHFHFNNASNGSMGIKNVPATRQLRMGFHVNPNNFTHSLEYAFIQFKDSGGTSLAELETTGSGGGNNLIVDIAGTNQDTEVGASGGNVYYHIGIDVKIDSVAGWMVVWKDGIEILRFEGNTGNADIEAVWMGFEDQANANVYMDDLYIDDTAGEGAAAAPPILYFDYVQGDGNGNYDGNWDGSDGNSVDNYLLLDEVPPGNDTDYIETSTADELESFTMDTIVLAGGQEVQAIIPTVYTRRTGITEEIALGTRLAATDLVGSDQAPSSSYSFLWERQTTKPGGGAWAQADIDGFELIVKSRGTF